MRNKSFTKRIMAVALSLIMIVDLMPLTAFADGTYTFPSYSQSGDNNSVLRYYLTDENAGSITVEQSINEPALFLKIDDGWYFEKWDTYFNGYEDRPILSDPAVKGSNPVSDDGYYTFYNINQNQPFSNSRTFLYISTSTNFYGDHSVTAVLKPILTVNADDGVSYEVTTNSPTTVSSNQTAVKYGDNAAITYSIDNKYIVTDVSANYGTAYSDNGTVVTVNSIKKPATVTIETRLKQHNVVFDANGGEGTMAQQSYSYGEAQALTANSFTRSDYTFAGWNTKSDGSGTAYTDMQSVTFTPANDGDSITLYAQWEKVVPSNYTVSFDANGGEDIAPITVTYGEKYGRLPSSAITGLSGGDSNWYLVDENGVVTDAKITKLSVVSQESDHTLFVKRNVLAPTVSIALTVPGGISDGYQYYIPGASQRVLTATVNNANTELLNYTYQWYKDGAPIEGATASVLTLDGNVADSGTYKVEVTATLKDGTGIVATTSSATGSKEQNVKILHAANTLNYDANGGEGGPQSSYTGGTSLNVSTDEPSRKHYDFIGWNTEADGSGDSYTAEDVYTFANDGGNGGCVVTLYAQWKVKEYTVTYMADGQTVFTEKVEYGKDATLPDVPHKDGYVGKWDSDGKNITADTEINAVYTINKYTVTYKVDGEVVDTVTVEHGKDATAPAIPEKEGYTQTAPTWDNDGKNITADTEINAVYTINKYTVTYQADGEVVIALEVEHGENVAFPELPKKDGYVGKWDRNNENITSDTVINAVYTEIDNVVPDELKIDNKTELEDTKKQLEDMLDDNSYTDDDKKDIQDAIDDIDDALEAIGNVEEVLELIDKLPDTIKKDDEAAIKAADDAYNALSDYEKSLVDEDTKKALDDAKAALAELKKPVTDPNSPATGNYSHLWLWVTLMFVSGAGMFGITINKSKIKVVSKK